MDDDANPDRCQPKTSLFLGCFGFSGKRSNKTTKISDNRRWFRRSTFLLKQSAGTKTVPLDSTASEKLHPKKNSMFIKSKLKKKSAADIPLKPPTPAPAVKSPHYKTRPSLEKKVMIENGKARKENHPTNESFCRKIEAIRNSTSQPGSPDTKTKSNRTIMPRSISFPANHKTQVITKKPRRESAKNLDPVVGMSIIMVTLVILMIWGRICAILCTCTWLYFVPRLRKSKQEPDQTNGLVFNEPEEYMKKRVILEGFLDRNHNHNRSFM